MKRVIVESPYAGHVSFNEQYLRACLADCFSRGEAPFASHGLYTQPGVLNDENPFQRALGIAAGLEWGAVAQASVVYCDFGISPGMITGIKSAFVAKRPIDFRWIRPLDQRTNQDDIEAVISQYGPNQSVAFLKIDVPAHLEVTTVDMGYDPASSALVLREEGRFFFAELGKELLNHTGK